MAYTKYTVADNVPCGIWGCEFLAMHRTHNPFAEMPMDAHEIDLCEEHDGDFYSTKEDRSNLKMCGCGTVTRRSNGICVVCFNLYTEGVF